MWGGRRRRGGGRGRRWGWRRRRRGGDRCDGAGRRRGGWLLGACPLRARAGLGRGLGRRRIRSTSRQQNREDDAADQEERKRDQDSDRRREAAGRRPSPPDDLSDRGPGFGGGRGPRQEVTPVRRTVHGVLRERALGERREDRWSIGADG